MLSASDNQMVGWEKNKGSPIDSGPAAEGLSANPCRWCVVLGCFYVGTIVDVIEDVTNN